MEAYKTPNVLVLWGNDFAHTGSRTYATMDDMIDGMRELALLEPNRRH